MPKYIACDLHKKYAVFAAIDEAGRTEPSVKILTDSLELTAYLKQQPPGTPVAVEASGSWYWFVDLVEQLGLEPRLVNPVELKKRLPGRQKTDVRDATGALLLMRAGVLPEVWIPSAQLRDYRGLLRTRLSLRRQATVLKNRIHGALRRYGQHEPDEPKRLFSGRGRSVLSRYVGALPPSTRIATRHEWALLDSLEEHIEELEKQIRLGVGQIGYVRLLKSLPGVGEILSATIYLEVGEVSRFPSAAHLASYAGLVPTVQASGGKTHLGRTSPVANHYLRWAYVEAADAVVMRKQLHQGRHVLGLYERLQKAKGHGKAAVAVARHLAEASWWVLTKKESYREPAPASMASSENGQAR